MNKNILIILVIVVVAAVGGYFGYDYYKKKKMLKSLKDTDFESDKKPDTKPQQQQNYGTSYKSESFPLVQGMQGESIRAMQAAIGITADGKFGPKTAQTLASKGYSTVVDAALYQKILGGSKQSNGTNNVQNLALDAVNSGKTILQNVGNIAVEGASWTPLGLVAQAAGINKDGVKKFFGIGFSDYSNYCNFV